MAHINEKHDLCTDAYIVNGDAVLLRLHEKYDIWIGPGGHLEPNEDPNESILREIWEEVGLKVELVCPPGCEMISGKNLWALVPPLAIHRHHVNDVHDHSVMIFVAKSETREVNPQTEADKGATCVWVTKEELDNLKATDSRLREETHRYALKALDLVKS